MPSIGTGLALLLFLTTAAAAQTTGTTEDHDALRKLKADITEAVNKRDYPKAESLLHQPFMATLVTQDSFTAFDKVKAYFENLYTRDFLKMKKVSISAEADDYSQIFQGTFAVNKGSTKEHYELADGRMFDMNGRWTAVTMKENGQWKLVAVHMGTNFLDNPVLSAVENSIKWLVAAAAALGLAAGFLAGWFVKRARG
jgi:ketosteroid isomerase-like protein